jgi:hypothetical protein
LWGNDGWFFAIELMDLSDAAQNADYQGGDVDHPASLDLRGQPPAE